MTVFDSDAFSDHEEVHFFADKVTGLRAIVAIHSTALGPSGGGVRMWPYESEAAALRDALRLSRAMTYKLAMTGIRFGGGKSVIIGDPRIDKTEALLAAFGRAVDSLGGRYVCAEDVGTTPDDMDVIRRETAHVVGLKDGSGDTSPATGRGVYQGIRAAVKQRLGRDDLRDVRVAVQGAGNVARHLCRHLRPAGAEIYITDIDASALARAVEEFGAVAVTVDAIFDQPVDVFSPCALGAVLNDDSIARLRAAIVCGGANNQLAEDRHGIALHERGILYAPDYVVNAGGAMSAGREGPDFDPAEVARAVEGIYDTCLTIFGRAAAEGIAPSVMADRLAEEIIARG